MPKLNTHTLILAFSFLAGLLASNWAYAQTATRAQPVSSSTPATAKVYVAFRMEKWSSKHVHDAAQANTHAETLRKLGCEVSTATHNGHTDVNCRTVFWKSLSLDSHEQAHQWISWLQQAGFETIHGHAAGQQTHGAAPSGTHRELVQFRMAEWRSQHVESDTELSQLVALYRGLGCQVETHQHAGHTDVKARCPEWMEVEMPSHPAADSWQKFLGDMGFETKHEH